MDGHDALGVEARLLQAIEENPDGITRKELSARLGVGEGELGTGLSALLEAGAVEEKRVGNMATLYPLEKEQLRKVLIVEDDQNINRLMKATIGKGYEVMQAFDGNEGIRLAKEFHPDLLLLDLMLPGPNGLEICQAVKGDPSLRHAVVIIVSAADERRNRFQGLKFGADYYIKKPFEPKLLRSLVNIFLRKRGKRFDPLTDLPDAARLSREVEHAVADGDFEISNLRLLNLGEFTSAHGAEYAAGALRLVSQIIQDNVREGDSRKGFVGYLGDGEFVVGGGKNETDMVVADVIAEFERVLPFIYQTKAQQQQVSQGSLELEDVFGEGRLSDPKRLKLVAAPVSAGRLLGKREEIMERKPKPDIGSYTLAELQEMLGSSNVDLTVHATPSGVSFSSASRPRK